MAKKKNNRGFAARDNSHQSSQKEGSSPTAARPAPQATVNARLPSNRRLVPKKAQDFFDTISAPESPHQGLWLQRYLPHEAIGKQVDEDENGNGHKPKDEHIRAIAQASKNHPAQEYVELRERHDHACASLANTFHLPLTLSWRMALHLSGASVLENASVCMHPVYGFAYMPGSGLKGLARAYAHKLLQNKTFEGLDEQTFRRSFASIFGTGSDDDTHAERGHIIFHDAWCQDFPQLDVDILTPHYVKYYQGTSSPGDWHNPIPNTFLTIAPKQRFRFYVSPASAADSDKQLAEQAARWLFGGLAHLGAGAKTAAGYGYFEFNSENKNSILKEEAHRVEEQEQDALKNAKNTAVTALVAPFQNLLKDQALFVSSEDNKRQGWKLLYENDAWILQAGFNFGKNYKKMKWGKHMVVRATVNGDGTACGPFEELNIPCPIDLPQ